MGYFGQRGKDFGTLNKSMAGLGALGDLLQSVGAFFEDLGDSAPLSVKFYPTVNAWASYQSPAADASLKGINTALGALGFRSSYDGLIRDWQPKACREISIWARQPVMRDWKLIAGGTVGNAGDILAKMTTAEYLAVHGNDALWALQGLAALPAFRAYMQPKAAASSIGAPSTTPTPTPTSPPPLVAQPTPTSEGGILRQLKSPLGLAAIGVAGLLVYTGTRGSRGARRRRR